jgi:UDP-N-acetylglucosamine:LPS N-acetylglucosamine transferase
MPKKVLILAGGGGHTGYAYALGQVLSEKGVSLFFLVPEGDRLSAKRLRKFGKVDFVVKPREPKTPTLEFAYRLPKSFVDSILKVSGEFDVAISTGSSFCIPPALIAWIRGVPLISIESEVRFTKASITARLLHPFSSINALQWEEQKRLLKGVVVGPMLPRPETKPWNDGYILVTGGTYGHKRLFDELAESNLQNVILQIGGIAPKPYTKKHPEWKVITYTEKFQDLIAGAEVVVTHYGFTMLETLAYGKPTVVVVNPEWTRTVGFEDAKCLAKKTNAVLVSKITTESLLNAIEKAKKRKIPTLQSGAERLSDIILKMPAHSRHPICVGFSKSYKQFR